MLKRTPITKTNFLPCDDRWPWGLLPPDGGEPGENFADLPEIGNNTLSVLYANARRLLRAIEARNKRHEETL